MSTQKWREKNWLYPMKLYCAQRVLVFYFMIMLKKIISTFNNVQDSVVTKKTQFFSHHPFTSLCVKCLIWMQYNHGTLQLNLKIMNSVEPINFTVFFLKASSLVQGSRTTAYREVGLLSKIKFVITVFVRMGIHWTTLHVCSSM